MKTIYLAASCLLATLLTGWTTSAVAQSKSRPAVAAPAPIQTVGFFKKAKPKDCQRCEEIILPPTAAPKAPAEAPAPQPPAAPPATPPAAPPAAPPAEPPAEPTPSADDLFAGGLDVASTDSSLAPNMLGDFAGTAVVGTSQPRPATSQGLDVGESARVRTLTRYKIADFNSPLPQTRLLYDFNYFGDAFQSGGKVYRNFGGIEYAFLGNLMSLEARFTTNTFNQMGDTISSTEIGDLRTVFKAVAYQNQGMALAGGIGMNWPTGGIPRGVPGVYTITPYIGYLFSSPNSPYFLQGFQQVDFPTHAGDQILMHTDVGAGYWLRRFDPSRFISGIVPTLEMHLYTPIGDSPSGSLLGLRYNDVLNLTAGTSFFVRRNLLFAVGVGIPVSNIKDYDLELQVHGQLRFGSSRLASTPTPAAIVPLGR